MMSDNLLLTSLWLVPLIGVVIVLALPKRPNRPSSGSRWAFTSLTFLITLVVLGVYLSGEPNGRRAPLARAGRAQQADVAARRPRLTASDESDGRGRPGRPPRMDSLFQHPVLPGRGRDQPQPGGADRAGQRAGVPGLVEHRQAGQGLLRALPAADAPA